MTKVEELTRKYWDISSAFKRRPQSNGTITTSGALKTLGTSIIALNPERALVRHMCYLQQRIINGDRNQCQTLTQRSQLIQFIKP